jgi:hypothetical protein
MGIFALQKRRMENFFYILGRGDANFFIRISLQVIFAEPKEAFFYHNADVILKTLEHKRRSR